MTGIWGELQHLNLWAAVATAADILIVAYIIYRTLLLIRGTGAVYMLIGLLVIVAIFVGARQLQLTTLSWLLNHVISYFLLIAIIVFQADIRRGLTRVGRRLFLFSHASVDTSVIEEVTQACSAMAANHTGALIVFEREADLSQFIQHSVDLEASVNRSLLHNIFAPWPDNPLHDGAVVIKNDRIQRAAAVLPLSANQDLSKTLGTRHRAAVGVTEETDAVCIVVSEQRGSISLCVAGRIRMNLSPDELRARLVANLAMVQSGRGQWVGRLVRQLGSSAGQGPRVQRGANEQERPRPENEQQRPRTEEMAGEAIRSEREVSQAKTRADSSASIPGQ